VYGLCVNPSSAFDDSEMYGHRIGLKAYEEHHAAERAEADYRTQSSAEHFERGRRRDGAANYKEIIEWQERERWFAYVEHGRETLTGDETLYNRKKWNWRKSDAARTSEEIEQRSARVTAWQLSGTV
jgi:hypothetical protein